MIRKIEMERFSLTTSRRFDEADDPGRVAASFFPQNSAVIKLHKQHQSYFAQAFLDCTFQFGKRVGPVS